MPKHVTLQITVVARNNDNTDDLLMGVEDAVREYYQVAGEKYSAVLIGCKRVKAQH